MTGKATKPKRDVYQEVTDSIVAALESGTVPWRKPWRDSIAARFAADGRPRNAISHRPYRGANAFLLPLVMAANGWSDPRFLTFKQAKELGGQVRKGSKGTQVTYWRFFEREDADSGKVSRIPMLRSFVVFNVAQCDGLPDRIVNLPAPDAAPAPIDQRGEAVITGMRQRPAIRRDGSAAFYEPAADRVTMPDSRAFADLDSWYGVAFHELAHATGHESRLKRQGVATVSKFGSADYGHEELVAELASAMVCRASGIDPKLEQSAAYIEGWLRAVKKDPKAFIKAASQAQKAADWILGVTYDDEQKEKVA